MKNFKNSLLTTWPRLLEITTKMHKVLILKANL
jgi:hypothetical protein